MSYESYFQQMVANLNNPYQTIADIIASYGGYLNNPTIDVKDPRIRTITEYLNELGANDYKYTYEDFLNTLNGVTDAAHQQTQAQLAQDEAALQRSLAGNYATAADTIRSQYAQGIQQGLTKGIQNANLLSTLLGTSQQNADLIQEQALNRYNAALQYNTDVQKNAQSALSSSQAAYETLMGNIRQLFNDEIQQRAADLQYNASVLDTNANYNAALNSNAERIYNNNQSALSSIAGYASSRAAQDEAAARAAAAAAAAASWDAYNNTQSYVAPIVKSNSPQASTTAYTKNVSYKNTGTGTGGSVGGRVTNSSIHNPNGL